MKKHNIIAYLIIFIGSIISSWIKGWVDIDDRLMTALGICIVLYVLDVPSIGLHQRDNEKLLKTLTNLRDMGISVIVVEHDHETMMYADHIIDIGPGAGVHGGEVCAQGTAKEIAKSNNSITGEYLSGKRAVLIPKKRNKFNPDRLVKLTKASGHNLKSVNLELPLDLFVCVTGVQVQENLP